MSPCLPDEKTMIKSLLVVHRERGSLFGVERRQADKLAALFLERHAAPNDIRDRQTGADLIQKRRRKPHSIHPVFETRGGTP